jgi:hypothetical protein
MTEAMNLLSAQGAKALPLQRTTATAFWPVFRR